MISPSFALPATIVSEATRSAVPGYAYLELDRVRVKRKDEPVTIYEPVGLLEE